jgi:hypothetical protein
VSSPVQRVGFDGENAGKAPDVAEAAARFLGAARAARVRDQLVGQGGLEPSTVRLASPPRAPTLDDPGQAGNRTIEIHLTLSQEPGPTPKAK